MSEQQTLCMNPRCHLMREHSPDECGWPVFREPTPPATPQPHGDALCMCGHVFDMHGNDGFGHCGATDRCRSREGCKAFRAATPQPGTKACGHRGPCECAHYIDPTRRALSPPPDVERLTQRPETGPMQFGDDWPGLFIRGDNAAGFGLTLDKLIDFAAKKGMEPFTLLEAVGLRRMFSAADARTQPDVQRAVLLSPSTPGEPT